MKKLYILLTLVFLGGNLISKNLYVNSTTGNDINNGSINNPYKTITKALSQAIANDSILVAPGSYSKISGEVFPLKMKSGVKLIGTGYAVNTIIDAINADTSVIICSANNSKTEIRGFIIQHGIVNGNTDFPFDEATGAGVRFIDTDSTLFEANWVRNNKVKGYQGTLTGFSTEGGGAQGGGIFVESQCWPTIRNCIISNNLAYGGPGRGYGGGFSGDPTHGGRAKGGGISAASGFIINNTFYGNIAEGGPGGVTNSGSSNNLGNGGEGRGGAFYGNGSNAKVQNCIFYKNSALGGKPGSRSQFGSGDYGAAYTFGGFKTNLFFENNASTAEQTGFVGNDSIIGIDPLLHSSSNYHLQATSIAINRGSNTYAPLNDFDGAVRASNPTIGAFEMGNQTPSTFFKNINIQLGNNVFTNTSVNMNISQVGSTVGKYILVHYFSSGRTGVLPSVKASPYYWSISTNADSLYGIITFDWTNLLNANLDTASLKLFHRSGPNANWILVNNSIRNGKTISAEIFSFSEFAFGSDNGQPIGINQSNHSNENVLVYPNPAINEINLKVNGKLNNASYYILDLQGRIVLTETQMKNEEEQIKFNLPKGLYLLHFMNNNTINYQRLTIQ